MTELMIFDAPYLPPHVYELSGFSVLYFAVHAHAWLTRRIWGVRFWLHFAGTILGWSCAIVFFANCSDGAAVAVILAATVLGVVATAIIAGTRADEAEARGR